MHAKRTIILAISLLLVAAGVFWWQQENARKSGAQVLQRSGGETIKKDPQGPSGDPVARGEAKLQKQLPHEEALGTLRLMQEELRALPADQAVARIQAFLDSGKDRKTGLGFAIGAGGTMKEWPTLRTFLVDALLAIDAQAAARISRGILSKPGNADEWALALRNLGRVETAAETRELLIERTQALINNPEWQADPSVGYLNAFDTLVHTDATESIPLLSGLIQKKDRKDLAHAGFLTLDRLVQRNPVDALQRLTANRTLSASRPEMVAQQFARADLRDTSQREIVRKWLLDPSRTPTELQSFAGVYPNNNQFVSHNLLSTSTQPTGAELAAHDRAALEIISSWQKDPAFQPVAEQLRTMVARLNQFTGVSQSPFSPPAK